MARKIDFGDIEILYETYFDAIYRFFYYKVLSRDIAEDLTSETFLAFVEQCKRDITMTSPKDYLWGICRNVFTKFLQKKYKEPAPASLDDIDFNSYAQEYLHSIDTSKDLTEIATKFVNQLPEKQKQILHMRLIEKEPLGDIATILNKDMNYVKTTQKRGISNLRKYIACTP